VMGNKNTRAHLLETGRLLCYYPNGLLSLLTVPTPGIPSDSIGHPLAALPKVRYVWHDRSSLPPFYHISFVFL